MYLVQLRYHHAVALSRYLSPGLPDWTAVALEPGNAGAQAEVRLVIVL